LEYLIRDEKLEANKIRIFDDLFVIDPKYVVNPSNLKRKIAALFNKEVKMATTPNNIIFETESNQKNLTISLDNRLHLIAINATDLTIVNLNKWIRTSLELMFMFKKDDYTYEGNLQFQSGFLIHTLFHKYGKYNLGLRFSR
jgi:hypothetical protein